MEQLLLFVNAVVHKLILLLQIHRYLTKRHVRNVTLNAIRTQFFNTDPHNISANRRRDKSKKQGLSDKELMEGCRLGLDSHADMSCVGRHAHILEVYHGKRCNVYPFDDSYEPIRNINTVNAAFAYDTDQGETYILVLNQCLDFSATMEHSLLCPNQARMNGVVVDDCPTALDSSGRSTHSVYFPGEDKRLPLLSKFPISFLPVRRPTREELETCVTLEVTSMEEWDTSLFDDIDLGVQSLHHHMLTTENFSTVLSKKMNVSAIEYHPSREIDPIALSKLWGIGIDAARQTLSSTTQNYIRKLEGKLSRRFKTYAHQRQY